MAVDIVLVGGMKAQPVGHKPPRRILRLAAQRIIRGCKQRHQIELGGITVVKQGRRIEIGEALPVHGCGIGKIGFRQNDMVGKGKLFPAFDKAVEHRGAGDNVESRDHA